jgi:D-alanyl-D-alanine carboxypeptidase (penicillin-binding protein 5/6)
MKNWKKWYRKNPGFIWIVLLCVSVSLFHLIPVTVFAEETVTETETDASQKADNESGPDTEGISAIVMESSTGQVIYEKNADEKLPPASVTKVMTLLLILEAVDEGKINLEDTVTVSEYAASMGGSQVFLEAGETQTVDTMIKCIAVASANDACVAMAEMIAGTEEAFVKMMNEKAAELGMKNTNFVNCNGLDTDGHLTTARDIAIMSRELTVNHPEIFEYTKIWMENITHKTNKGESEFGLTNTNKLMRQYEYATGLKTGSTGKAKFCLSATATKNDVDLIAVVMAEPDSKTRVKDAISLLNYGFSTVNKYTDDLSDFQMETAVSGGEEVQISGRAESDFSYVDLEGKDLSGVERHVQMKKEVQAPVKTGDLIGTITYTLDDQEIGNVKILASQSVKKLSYLTALARAWQKAAL